MFDHLIDNGATFNISQGSIGTGGNGQGTGTNGTNGNLSGEGAGRVILYNHCSGLFEAP